MKILFYGAGVIGSVYAARLQAAGNEVSMLARGQRLRDLQEYGVVLKQAMTGQSTTTRVNVVERLSPEYAYDLIIVAMRKNQVATVLPILSANQHTPNVLFMVNTPSGYEEWIEAVGRDRLLLGFPGAGGTLEGHVVRYTITHQMQPTTLGEPSGRLTKRLKEIAQTFKQAGFPVEISRNIDAWQKYHVALISPVADAIYMAGGDRTRLAQMPEALHLMVRAITEGFRVLRTLGIPITPPKLRLWLWLPEPVQVAIMKRWSKTQHFEMVAVRHANVARDEMQRLAQDFQDLARKAAVETPSIDELEAYIDLLPRGDDDRIQSCI